MTKMITIDRMPAITWNWLKLNDRQVKFASDGTAAEPALVLPEGVAGSETIPAVEGGAGAEFETAMDGASVTGFTVPAGTRIQEPLKLTFDFADGTHPTNRYGITVGAGSEATVIMDFRSAEDAEGSAGLSTKISVEEGALLHFVQIFRAGDHFQVINDVGAVLADRARIEEVQVIFSGKETDLGNRITLQGHDASADMQVGYLAEKDHRVDLNYVTPYIGERGETNLNVSGVLRDEAFKTFRGTIDFRRGCTDSVGDENESVLLMDDHVVNQSVPVILCDEENVEGNHGASVGKLDESLIFYLMSRGISYDDIYEMMARAKLEAIFARIPDEDTVNELREYNEKEA
ncbi:MAG: SufD family Fe-S cluster assembly protein [Clostridia bacterium]|nr:SufD family Fe-S cluster assembly protein [Clostridia bacterium]